MSKPFYRLIVPLVALLLLALQVPYQLQAMSLDDTATHTESSAPESDPTTGDVGGWIVDSVTNANVAGVRVRLIGRFTGTIFYTTTTDSNGVYFFDNVGNGSYWIRPDSPFYTFDPTQISLDVENDNHLQENFEATRQEYDLSGRIDDNGTYLNGITVNLYRQPNTTTPIATATTSGTGSGNTGKYTFTDVPAGDDYRIVPVSAIYAFDPPDIDVNDLSSNQSSLHFEANLLPFNASGRVTINGDGLSGVTLSLNSGQQTTTDSNGNYTFTNLSPGTYTVTPSRAGYSFTPPNRTFNGNNGNTTIPDFDASQIPYEASGQVTLNGAGLSGVTLTLNTGQTTTTSSGGNYQFSNLPHGTYSVTPSRSGYSFTPTSRPFTISTANVTGLNFTATLGAYNASGRVTFNGQGLAGVTMTLDTNPARTEITDSSGDYTFEDLGQANYTVTPSRNGYSFQPTSRPFTIFDGNVGNLDFSAALIPYTATGRVTLPNGIGLAGVTLTLNTGGTVQTDSNGNYTFNNLLPATYTVTPSRSGYTFDPTNRQFTITIGGGNVTIPDFTATQDVYTASGRVTSGVNGLAGVTLTLNTNPERTATTDANGNYLFDNLPAGNYRVTPSLSGYSFAPSFRDFTITTGNVANVDFVASLILYDATGRVTSNGVGLANITLTLNTNPVRTATTDANGNYTFEDLAPGNYRVTPTTGGYVYTPPFRDFTVDGPVSGLDFTAALGTYNASGRVADGATPVSGVTMTLRFNGVVTGVVVTDLNGEYTFQGLQQGGYRLIPERSRYTFSPAERSFSISTADVTNLNFEADPIPTLYLPMAQRGYQPPAPTPTVTGTVPPSTPTATPPVACRTEIEPNNFANADANGDFEAGRCITGAIPAGDTNDFFRIQHPGGNFNATLDLSTIPAPTNFDLTLYRVENGQTVLVNISPQPAGSNESITLPNLPARTYYLGVQSRSGNSTGQYRLQWTYTP